jgi:redox-sensitive bicupin YhaK (pirin superfamily)
LWEVFIFSIRKSKDRGQFDFGWLQTAHSFSFGEYFDANHQNFRCLRVINEDRIQPSSGFPLHGHKNMEILTYVISGTLEHKDSLGNGALIGAGDLQSMSAGTGIRHSEFNPSASDSVHLYQIWILPSTESTPPKYQQKNYQNVIHLNSMKLVASATGEQDSLLLNQDVKIFLGKLSQKNLIYRLEKARHAWIQVITGSLIVENNLLSAGDGMAISNEQFIALEGLQSTEFLFFDLP